MDTVVWTGSNFWQYVLDATNVGLHNRDHVLAVLFS